MSANGKGSQTAAAVDEEETAHKEDSEPPLAGMEKDEKTKSTDKMVSEDEALAENGNIHDKIKQDGLTNAPSDSVTEPEADLETDRGATSATETVMEAAEEKTGVNAPKAGNDETRAREETKSSISDGKAAFQEMAMPDLPKVKYP